MSSCARASTGDGLELSISDGWWVADGVRLCRSVPDSPTESNSMSDGPHSDGAQSWSQEQVGLQPTDDNESAPPAKPNAGPALVRSYSFAPGRKGGPSEGPSGSGAGTHPETNADALQEDLEMKATQDAKRFKQMLQAEGMKATQDAKRFKQMLHAEGLVATRTFDSEDEYAVFAPKRIGTGAPVLAIGQRFAMTLMAEEKPQERHAAGHADTQPRLQNPCTWSADGRLGSPLGAAAPATAGEQATENPGSGSIGGALAPEGLEEETRPAVPTRLRRILVDLERDANTHAEWAADNNASGKGERGASHHTRNADDPPLAHGMVWHEWEAIDTRNVPKIWVRRSQHAHDVLLWHKFRGYAFHSVAPSDMIEGRKSDASGSDASGNDASGMQPATGERRKWHDIEIEH